MYCILLFKSVLHLNINVKSTQPCLEPYIMVIDKNFIHLQPVKIIPKLWISLELTFLPYITYFLVLHNDFALLCIQYYVIRIPFIVPRLFEEKQRDIVFGFPSFRPPIGVCTLCAQLLLQFYSDSFET